MIRQLIGRMVRRGVRPDPAFDAAYYLANNPDIQRSGVDPFEHFMRHGWKEGRNPSAGFVTLWYKHRHLGGSPDVNPLEHYRDIGRGAGLSTAPGTAGDYIALQKALIAGEFEDLFYRQKFDDRLVGQDATEHYLTTGWREGRDPTPRFSTTAHLAANGYLRVLDIAPFFHALSVGAVSAMRTPPASQLPLDPSAVQAAIAPHFDAAHYLSTYGDVREAGADPLQHFLTRGWREGRNPTPLFWTDWYASENDDVSFAEVNPFYHYLRIGRAEGRRPNPVGDALWKPPPEPDAAAWTRALPHAAEDGIEVQVIVPVYRGRQETLTAIHAVLANPQKTPFQLLVVNDCGPDAELNAILSKLAGSGLFSYIVNADNLGFTRTINRGLATRQDVDVVLLNSDTVVHGDWLDRLAAHARRNPGVATVTPLSNNATICSYPQADANNVIALELSLADLDCVAATANAGRATEVPTGVGFCMYVTRAALNAVGGLDPEAFPRGYGEENDFCMRAGKAGFSNLRADDVFVYHVGQVSFGPSALENYRAGQTALDRKHPDYLSRLRRFVDADPGRESVMRLDLWRLAAALQPGPVVFVTHGWGGGIETHVAQLARGWKEAGTRVLCLRVGAGDPRSVEIDVEWLERHGSPLFLPNLEPLSVAKHLALLEEFLDRLSPRLIHVHSLAGLDWSSTQALMGMLEQRPCPYVVTAHDFSPICHRRDMVTPEGVFCGQPPVEACMSCEARDRKFAETVEPQARRDRYGAFLAHAAQLMAPSADTSDRIRQVFPDLSIDIRPHTPPFEDPPWLRQPAERQPLRIAVIGAIGPHKGADVIADLARDARLRQLPVRFSIVGYSDIGYDLSKLGVAETGRYESDAEAFAHLRTIEPHLAFLPSIWPETFCYTLSMTLAVGLPTVVFDLGAQGQRLQALGQGVRLDPALRLRPSALNDALLDMPIDDLWAARRPEPPVAYRELADDYYRLGPSGA